MTLIPLRPAALVLSCALAGLAPAPTVSAQNPPPAAQQPEQKPSEQKPAEKSPEQSVTEATEAAKKEIESMTKDPLGTLGRWQRKAVTWVQEDAPRYAVKVVLFVILLLLSRLAAGIAGGIVRRALSASRLKVSNLLRDFAGNATRKIVFFLGLLFSLSAVGVPIGPFLAAFGAIGLVVGFALSETLNNFAAGVMILLYRPYDVGDFVDAGGVRGTVSAMTLVSTTMLTPDNQRIVVPNGKIWGNTITNVTANPTRRVDLTAGIGYDDDIERAEGVLARICADHPKVHADPEPVIRLHELGDSSVNFVVRAWADTGDYWQVYWDLTKAIKVEFDKAGLSIPYPQRDVHLHNAAS